MLMLLLLFRSFAVVWGRSEPASGRTQPPPHTKARVPVPPTKKGGDAANHCHLFVNQYESSHVCYNLKYFINVD